MQTKPTPQQHPLFFHLSSQNPFQPCLMQTQLSPHMTQTNLIFLGESMFYPLNNPNGKSGCKVEEEETETCEPKYKSAKMEQQPGVTTQKVIAVTKVVRVTKTVYKTRVPINKPSKNMEDPPIVPIVDLERTRKLRPTLYRLLKTLKNPESIEKIKQSLRYFDQLELMAAARKLQEKPSEVESKKLLKSHLAVMDNFIQSLVPEKTNLMYFNPQEELAKMMQEVKAGACFNDVKPRAKVVPL